MELIISPKNDTWKYFVSGSFIGFSVLLLLAYQTHPYMILLAARTTTRVEFVPLDETNATNNPEQKMMINITDEYDSEKQEAKTVKKCDMFDGRWVYMPDDDPSYDSVKCPFIEEKMSCKKNGRPDFEYEKWRWEAFGCDIPL